MPIIELNPTAPNVQPAARVVFEKAGVPTTGTDFAGVAMPGALCIDTTNKRLYQNTGTQASPTWTAYTQP